MENIKHFLESSTIHGLNYISTETKYVRLFWILVVIAGFTGAAFLIQTSFQNWSDSPITTTTEILPISQITFPKVTVCPPKDTYTDLNIVLDMMNNMTLDNYTINNISKFAVDLIIENLNDTEMSRAWTLFYQDLFEKNAPDQILLTLNRILKGRRTLINNDMENIAENIFQEFKSSILNANGRQNSRSSISLTSKKYINHPVHIINEKANLSPSAFIPFCEFGGIMTAMGVKIEGFHIPVCNTFQAKIFNDQLCYEVDLNKFKNENNIKNQLKLGLSFLMDYNKDRQITLNQTYEKLMEDGLVRRIMNFNDNQQAFIYLNTIGNH